MSNLYRLIAIVAGIWNMVAFGYEFVTSPALQGNAVIGTVVSWEGFRAGMIGCGIALAAWGCWPGIRWAWTYRARLRLSEESAAHAELCRRQEEEQHQRKRIIGWLELIRKHDDDLLYDLSLGDPIQYEQSRETVDMTQQQLDAAGFGPPPHMRENWPIHAARLIPHVQEHGLEHARHQIDVWIEEDANSPI